MERAITYAECFYLIAWQVRLALTSHGKPLGPFEPQGVKQVRNWLIVHQDRHIDAPLLPSWAISGDGDIRLSLGAQWASADGIPDTPRPTYRDPGLPDATMVDAAGASDQLSLRDLRLGNDGFAFL